MLTDQTYFARLNITRGDCLGVFVFVFVWTRAHFIPISKFMDSVAEKFICYSFCRPLFSTFWIMRTRKKNNTKSQPWNRCVRKHSAVTFNHSNGQKMLIHFSYFKWRIYEFRFIIITQICQWRWRRGKSFLLFKTNFSHLSNEHFRLWKCVQINAQYYFFFYFHYTIK